MGSIKLGNTSISSIYLGSTEIKKVYCGSTLIWQKAAPQPTIPLSCDLNNNELDASISDNHSTIITSNSTWTATVSNTSWIIISSTDSSYTTSCSGSNGDTLYIKTTTNTNSSSRNGSITITCDTESITISVYQSANTSGSVFRFDPTYLNFVGSGSETIRVYCAKSWTASSSNNKIRISPSSGSSGWTTMTVRNMYVDNNEHNETITFTNSSSEVGTFSVQCTPSI